MDYIKIALDILRFLFTGRKSVIQPSDLKYHPFFAHMRRIIFSDIEELRIRDLGRRLLFRDLLLIKFKTILKHTELLLDAGVKDWDKDKLYAKLCQSLDNARSEYQAESLRHGIPEVVVAKVDKVHLETMQTIYHHIEAACRAPIFDSTAERLYACLSVLDSNICVGMVVGATNTLSSLNGELSGVEYRGILCDANKNGSYVLYRGDPKLEDLRKAYGNQDK